MGEDLHPLLRRQLRRLESGSETTPPDPAAWQELLRRVSRAYVSAEEDRYTLERSMEISSRSEPSR